MPTPPTTAAIVVAAGRGLRAGGGTPKQWRDLGGKPVLARTLDALRASGLVSRLCVVIGPEDASRMAALSAPDVIVAPGGATRAASVRAGLEALAEAPPDLVLIHDAARPLLSRDVIARVLTALDEHDAAAPAVEVTDALWRGADGLVTGTQDRAGLWRAQTPQGFRFAAILAAHRDAPQAAYAADDVEVARGAGLAVAIVAGDEDNLKITRPEDFVRATRLGDFARATPVMEKTPQMQDIRTGQGYDVHRLGPGDHVVICGVKIPFGQGLDGHSDADVGMHALTDALYGALAAGDIGTHFPPSDPQWKGAASHIFLAHACGLARKSGFGISNADVTLICEEPKIGPHAVAMRTAMARIMEIDIDRVSVKATTSERLGFTGRGEGIAAMAIATLVRP